MKSTLRQFSFILITLLAWSCSGTSFLEDGEKWLYKQQIKGVKSIYREPAQDLILLKPNTKLPILGPLGAGLYETGKMSWDSMAIVNKIKSTQVKFDSLIAKKEEEGKKIRKLKNKKSRKLAKLNKRRQLGNFRMRTGAPLSRYDSQSIETSRKRIENYMKSKGYREAEVSIEYSETQNRVKQNFLVEKNKRSFIDSTLIRTGDPAIAFLIQSKKNESFLQINQPYDKEDIDKERERIEKLLKNNGYFEIVDNFINFEVYYAPNQTDLWITTVINKPANKDFHKSYDLDSIIINTYGNENIVSSENYDSIQYNLGINYYNPKVIDSRLKIHPYEKYSLDKIRNTQRQLLNMNIFRYVNINFDTTLIPGKFVTNIYTAPQRRYQLTQEVGLNMTEGLPGPFYNANLLNRNIFGGAEILQLGGFVGSEGVSGLSDQNSGVLSSFQYGGNLSLTFPRFNIPFSKNKLSKKVYNATNTASLGYSFTDRPEYRRSNLNGRWSYAWQNESGKRSFTLNLADVNLIDTRKLDPEFLELLLDLLLQGNTLALAFDPSFVSSTSFNAIYNFNYANPIKSSSFFRYLAELGGNMTSLLGRKILEKNDLEYYQYAKLQLDYRRHIPTSNTSSFALRAHAGLAYAYGDNEALPYEKYFFTGGSNSNRAWSPRRLGPGSSFPYLLDEDGNNVIDEQGNRVPNRTGESSYQFEQPGDILLELNAEYRAKLSGFVDYAFFIDAGNIWYRNELDPDPAFPIRSSPGASFELNRFYKEIAVGLGLGLRLDFSFLVFRFDYGMKIKDPRFPEGDRWQIPFKRADQGVWNIAVGYPF